MFVNPSELAKRLHALSERITAAKSRWPNTSGIFEMRVRVGTGRQSIAQLFLCSFLPPWETDFFVRSLAQKAYQAQYQGVWNEVQEYLEHFSQTPEDFVDAYLKRHSVEELFGNLFREAEREIAIVRWRDPSRTSNRPVKRRVRRRGYRDHGTLRPSHQRHGDPPVGPEKQDRRKNITHPLLSNGETSEKIESVAWDLGS